MGDNEARMKGLLRAFVAQLQRRMAANKRTHTVAAVCQHGKHRSVAFVTLLSMLLRMLGADVEVEHLSKWGWGKRTCGWVDCAMCDCRQNGEDREAVGRRALPWLIELLN